MQAPGKNGIDMKKELLIVLLPFVVACSMPEKPATENPVPEQTVVLEEETATTTKAEVDNINVGTALEVLADPKVILLDVRTPEEQKAGVIGQPICIDIRADDFEARVKAEVNKDDAVLVYCHAGGRSARAAQQLVDMGYTQVMNLEGGLSTWEADGNEVQILE